MPKLSWQENIKEEALHIPEVEVPTPSVSEIDLSEDVTSGEFAGMEMDDTMSTTIMATDDNASDDDDDDTALVAADNDNEEEA